MENKCLLRFLFQTWISFLDVENFNKGYFMIIFYTLVKRLFFGGEGVQQIFCEATQTTEVKIHLRDFLLIDWSLRFPLREEPTRLKERRL